MPSGAVACLACLRPFPETLRADGSGSPLIGTYPAQRSSRLALPQPQLIDGELQLTAESSEEWQADSPGMLGAPK